MNSKNYEEKISEFSDMELKPELLEGIYKYGFEKPSEIQQRGILPLIKKKDLIAQAQSGTGKTATFVIGTLQNIKIPINNVQVIVVAPTRELASQIQAVYSSIGKYSKIKTMLSIGGTNIKEDTDSYFNNKPHIIV